MKLLHFVDAAGTDETFIPASAVTMIQVTDNASVIVGFKSADPAVTANDQVDLTCTAGKSDEVALRLAQEIAQGNHDVLKVIASTAPFADVSAVAYTAGS
tara:strand:+ start:218 stop:517 length:300 start_codon:yes stop_codon:yes gene_type:complete